MQIDDLLLGGAHLENFRARVLWDVARVQLEGMQAKLDRAVAHRKAGREPARLAAQLQADGEGQRDELAIRQAGCRQPAGDLRHRHAIADQRHGGGHASAARRIDLGTLPPLRSVAGSYSFSWWQAGPRLRLTGLNLRTEDETYTGRGATQDDGRLVILLTNGAKEMRMSGTLAKLRVE